MPPAGKKVPPEKIALIERWIAAGAKANREEHEASRTAKWPRRSTAQADTTIISPSKRRKRAKRSLQCRSQLLNIGNWHSRRLDSRHVKVRRQLDMLDAAISPEGMNVPGWHFHGLKGRGKALRGMDRQKLAMVVRMVRRRPRCD
jgi:hypothetical protein